MASQIKHTCFYPHSKERIWDYLTKPELIEQWLMKNDFEPVIGRDFTFNSNPIPSLNLDGVFYCKVLEIVPLEKITYSWKAGPGNQIITLDSIVMWTISASEEGTEVTVEQTGFKEINFEIFTAMNTGWLKNMQKIDGLISNSKHDAAGA